MLISLFALAAAVLNATPIRLEPSGDQWVVRAVAVENATLTVSVDSPDSELPALLGSVTNDSRDRIFTPRFPFQPGVRYRAVVANHPPYVFEIPAARNITPANVVHVYPSATTLPENQLKFYIEFATPMTRGDVYRHIHLLDERGNPVELPFLELDQELWDSSLQRFTLYFDPGRVKSDLVPNRDVGSPLRNGRTYTLVIDSAWKDANGIGLSAEHRKFFRVGPRDEASPEPKQWHIEAPSATTRELLSIAFNEPMEQALASRMIEVRDASNRAVAGDVVVNQDETRWQFTPDRPWTSGDYSLVIDTALEDLAGNKVSRPFEVGIRSDAARKSVATWVRLSVRVR